MKYPMPPYAAFLGMRARLAGGQRLEFVLPFSDLVVGEHAERASRTIAHSADPGRLARVAYTYVPILIVAGIIVSAVGDELTLAHPSGPTEWATALILVGGPALFLLGATLFKLAVFGLWPWPRLVGLAILLVLLAFGTSQLLWGPLSDRFGRRPILLWGLTAYTLAAIGAALAPSMALLIVWRTLQGAAMGAAVMCARAIVRDLYSPLEGARAMSRGLTGLGIIACGGPLLGGLLSDLFGWRFALLTGGSVAICGASAAMAIAAVLPRNEHSESNLIFTVLGVTVLSTIAMIAYPMITTVTGLDPLASGVFLGGTIHDVAQVVGAGFSISDEVGETATLVKLMRVTMLASTSGTQPSINLAPIIIGTPARQILSLSATRRPASLPPAAPLMAVLTYQAP